MVVEPDGAVRPVPTEIIQIDGVFYARIRSLTNSIYALVAHPVAFRDMAGHWAEASVHNMGSRLVVGGVGDGRFEPDRPVTRAEFAAMVVRALGLKPAAPGLKHFTDVTASDWFSAIIATAHNNGLIAGFADGGFRPHHPITREEAMTVIARAMKVTGLMAKLLEQNVDRSLERFQDAADLSPWAKDAVSAAMQAGIITGRSDTRLAPQAEITRAEAAVIVERLLKASGLIA